MTLTQSEAISGLRGALRGGKGESNCKSMAPTTELDLAARSCITLIDLASRYQPSGKGFRGRNVPIPLGSTLSLTLRLTPQSCRSPKQDMPRSELLELSRSCYHTVLARVSTLLTGLRVVATAPPPAAEGDAAAAIPVSLPGSKLFAVLPHLLCPGT